MSRLREQRNLIEAIYNINEGSNDIIGIDKKLKVDAITGQANEAEILFHALKFPILLGEEKIKFATQKEDAGFLDRCYKISTLIQSCLDDELLIPTRKESGNMAYYKITSRGTDLLNYLGFITIAFKKHSQIITFLWGSLFTGAIFSIVWIVTNLDKIKLIIDLFNKS